MRKVSCERSGDTLILRNATLYDPFYPPVASIAVFWSVLWTAALSPVLALILAVVVIVFHIRMSVHGMDARVEISDQWVTASRSVWSCRVPRDTVRRLNLEYVPNGTEWADDEATRWLPVVLCHLKNGTKRRLFVVANADLSRAQLQTAIDELNPLFVTPADRAALQARIRKALKTAVTNNTL